MTIDDQIRDKKLWYDINIAAEIDNYEYFTGEEIFPSNQK